MKIKVMDADISVQRIGNEDYISLTDMARSQMQEHIIFKWLSTKSTIEYLGEWESLYNPDFNYTEFGTIKNMAGSNNFVLSTKQWILSTNALGIVAKTGRYGGTFAHRDIAYHFGMWISPRFHLLLIHEYQRLKAAEQAQLGWSVRRELSKINYHIHTDAIKQNLIPATLSKQQMSMVYASEADVLNVALFGFISLSSIMPRASRDEVQGVEGQGDVGFHAGQCRKRVCQEMTECKISKIPQISFYIKNGIQTPEKNVYI